MPITRRRRANPPEQPENNNHLAEQPESIREGATSEQVTEAPQGGEKVQEQETQGQRGAAIGRSEGAVYASEQQSAPLTPPSGQHAGYSGSSSSAPLSPVQMPAQGPTMNGERHERIERPDYISTIEGGRRTARGELFRRPPQPPTAQTTPAAVSAAPSLQAPTHEISLPLGNLLHLAYNPGYTGSEGSRGELLSALQNESKTGGRARCWSCGSLAVVYDRWETRSKNFGEIGIAYCEICGVWSVM